MRFCPFAHRVHLILEHLKVPYEVAYIHLKRKPEWLTKYSPQGQVPAIGLTNETGTPYLYGSMLIVDYLDAKFGQGQSSLYPANDPLGKATDLLWIDRFCSTVAPAFYKIAFGSGAEPAPEGTVNELAAAFDQLETELRRRGTARYFAKSATQPCMLDYMIWPWIERVAALQLASAEDGKRFELTAVRYPKLVEYQKGMLTDEAVKKWHLAPEVHYEFMLTYWTGEPDFDMLFKK